MPDTRSAPVNVVVFQDLKPADLAPSRSQQMLHRLFQSFAPGQNAKLANNADKEPLISVGHSHRLHSSKGGFDGSFGKVAEG